MSPLLQSHFILIKTGLSSQTIFLIIMRKLDVRNQKNITTKMFVIILINYFIIIYPFTLHLTCYLMIRTYFNIAVARSKYYKTDNILFFQFCKNLLTSRLPTSQTLKSIQNSTVFYPKDLHLKEFLSRNKYQIIHCRRS